MTVSISAQRRYGPWHVSVRDGILNGYKNDGINFAILAILSKRIRLDLSGFDRQVEQSLNVGMAWQNLFSCIIFHNMALTVHV